MGCQQVALDDESEKCAPTMNEQQQKDSLFWQRLQKDDSPTNNTY
jgi:hypothetical protein